MNKTPFIFAGVMLLLLCALTALTAQALTVDVQIPEKYLSVDAGDRFYFQVDIKYPENTERKDLSLEYEVRQGTKVIAYAKVLRAIETQASFMDFIIIPEDTES
jgi:hypothetical protein